MFFSFETTTMKTCVCVCVCRLLYNRNKRDVCSSSLCTNVFVVESCFFDRSITKASFVESRVMKMNKC